MVMFAYDKIIIAIVGCDTRKYDKFIVGIVY